MPPTTGPRRIVGPNVGGHRDGRALFVFAAPAHADKTGDYIKWLYGHNLGCVQGSLRCSSPSQLIEMGQSHRDEMDNNGDSVYEAVDKVIAVSHGLADAWVTAE